MPDTETAIEIGSSWTNLTTLSGIPSGTEVVLQNIGLPQDVIELATSLTEPAIDFKGVYMKQITPMMRVTIGEADIWARLYRYDKDQSRLRTAKVQIQVVT